MRSPDVPLAVKHVGITRTGLARWFFVLLVPFALVAAACGSDEPEASPGGSEASATSTDATPAATSDGESDDESLPRAEVTIGDETFIFSAEGFAASSNCRPSDDGFFVALLTVVDESGALVSRGTLDVELSHDGAGADGNFVNLRLGHLEEDDGYIPGWFGDGDHAVNSTGLEPGTSQVDSYTIDGTSVSGTATFVDFRSDAAFFRGETDSVETVQGTFTITCRDR